MNVDNPQVAYIGLGNIGIELSRHIHNNLIKTGGKPLLVHNRTRARAEQLQARVPDIKIADTVAQVAQEADIVFTCLLNDAAVQQVVEGLLVNGLRPGSIIVEQSTIAPQLADALSKKAQAMQVQYVSAPIMGPPPWAAAANVIPLVSGPQNAREKAIPYLIPAVGSRNIQLGEDVTDAPKLKLNGNFFVTAVVETLSEGLTLGEATGVGQENVKKLLDMLFPNTLVAVYADRIVNKIYENQVLFSLTGARKDASHILDMANAHKAKLPTTENFLKHLDQTKSKHGDIDISGVVLGKPCIRITYKGSFVTSFIVALQEAAGVQPGGKTAKTD